MMKTFNNNVLTCPQQLAQSFKRLLFLLFSSSMVSIALYYLLKLSGHVVFGSLYRMYLYHDKHPISYILIVCFFFSILGTCFIKQFSRRKLLGKIFIVFIILILTILISSPFGGMLWHYHDMQAGWFPGNWLEIMLSEGIHMGTKIGWLIILMSIPYNICIAILFFFLIIMCSKID